jgi:rubrerythrin
MKSCENFLEMPKKGKWVDRYGGKYANKIYECSRCMRTALYDFGIDVLGHEVSDQVFSHFCPNCGADMRGTEDGKL